LREKKPGRGRLPRCRIKKGVWKKRGKKSGFSFENTKGFFRRREETGEERKKSTRRRELGLWVKPPPEYRSREGRTEPFVPSRLGGTKKQEKKRKEGP